MNAGILAPGYAPPQMPRPLLGNPQPVPMPYGVAGDPYWNSVVLYLPMTGPHGSRTFTDVSRFGHAVTANGNAQVSAAQSKFGDASGYLSGSGDFLSFAGGSSLQFGTASFTIEGWIYPTASGGGSIFSNTDSWQAGRYNLTCGQPGASRFLQFYANSVRSATVVVQSSGAIPLNAWTHFALVRAGIAFAMFINGTQTGTFTSAASMSDPSNITLRYGATDGGSQQLFTGHIAHFRITRGVARYTSSFAPITAPFPAF